MNQANRRNTEKIEQELKRIIERDKKSLIAIKAIIGGAVIFILISVAIGFYYLNAKIESSFIDYSIKLDAATNEASTLSNRIQLEIKELSSTTDSTLVKMNTALLHLDEEQQSEIKKLWKSAYIGNKRRIKTIEEDLEAAKEKHNTSIEGLINRLKDMDTQLTNLKQNADSNRTQIEAKISTLVDRAKKIEEKVKDGDDKRNVLVQRVANTKTVLYSLEKATEQINNKIKDIDSIVANLNLAMSELSKKINTIESKGVQVSNADSSNAAK